MWTAALKSAKRGSAGIAVGLFWVVWAIAAIPTALWFGWGMLDSLANGALPDVAELPPQLWDFARTLWHSIFVSGAGVASVQTVTRAAENYMTKRTPTPSEV